MAETASAEGGGSAWLRALRARIDRSLPNLRWRHAHEPLPITLNQRRIYIVPSLFGLFFGLMMLAVMAGALNYNNNGALLFGLLPVCLAAVSMLQTFRNLDRLSLVQVNADPVHAGDPLTLELHLHAGDGRARFGLSLTIGALERHVDVAPGATVVVRFPIATTRRGWLSPPPVRISTRWPFGLFYAWSYLHSDARALVYPMAETPAHPLPLTPDDSRHRGSDPGDDDLRSLRAYQLGDPLRMVAWKASARTGDLHVRQLEAPRAREAVFDFERLTGLDTEARLRRLTRWVVDTEDRGNSYRLLLPGTKLGPGSGSAHKSLCLKHLALHALPNP